MKLTSEQLAYEHAKSVGWNEAIEACAKIAETHDPTTDLGDHIARAIRALDRSMQAIDD